MFEFINDDGSDKDFELINIRDGWALNLIDHERTPFEI